jgi:hypothetical protein
VIVGKDASFYKKERSPVPHEMTDNTSLQQTLTIKLLSQASETFFFLNLSLNNSHQANIIKMHLTNAFTTFLTLLLTSYTTLASAGCYVTGDFITAEATGIQVGRACHGYGDPRVAGAFQGVFGPLQKKTWCANTPGGTHVDMEITNLSTTLSYNLDDDVCQTEMMVNVYNCNQGGWHDAGGWKYRYVFEIEWLLGFY